MKQEERNRRSRENILACAFEEFAAHGYTGGGLNQICIHGGISKGLLYHYYTGKDDLYVACVEKLFREMTDSLKQELNTETVTVESYFAVRMRFFQRHPRHRQLFYDVVTYPQSHLAAQVDECRAEFDSFNDSILRTILQRERLSEHVTLDGAIRQFRAFVNFLGVYIREDSAEDAERKAEELLHTMLYGLIAR